MASALQIQPHPLPLHDLGATPKVSVQVQAQVPTSEEAIQIALGTLEAFAPQLLVPPAFLPSGGGV
ncbi:MAG: hypothetical protein ACXVZT_06925 [Terriglobales bacterium]